MKNIKLFERELSLIVDEDLRMADYMASRSFIDIPSITEEWKNVEMEMMISGELPF